jgi:hypothetical protein
LIIKILTLLLSLCFPSSPLSTAVEMCRPKCVVRESEMNAIETARYGTVEDLSTLLGSGIDINEPDEVIHSVSPLYLLAVGMLCNYRCCQRREL